MKLASLSLLIGGAGLVAAVPIRIVVVGASAPTPIGRIGLAGANAFHSNDEPALANLTHQPKEHDSANGFIAPIPVDQPNPFAAPIASPPRHGCAKNKPSNVVLAKMEEFSRYFRKLLGFNSIEEIETPMIHYRVPPRMMHARPPPVIADSAESINEDHEFHILPFMPGPHMPTPNSHSAAPPTEFRGRHRMWMHRHRPHTFLGRLHKALFTLSPWEGRALSFVVGCGIGVLLRMFYVFTILAFRSFFYQPRVRLEENAEEEEQTPLASAAPATEAPGSTMQPSAQVPPPDYEYNEKTESQ